MPHDHSPLRFDPSFEVVPPDEEETQAGLTEAMLSIQRKTHADAGYRADANGVRIGEPNELYA